MRKLVILAPTPSCAIVGPMQDKTQSRRAGRAGAVLATAILVACSPQQPQEAESDNLANEVAQRAPLPIIEPPFSRSRLLLTAARAASAHAAGADNLEIQRTLNGKQFEVRLRFGCDGPGPGGGDHGWSLDPDGRTLRLRAVPSLTLEDELVRSVAGDGAEAAEGFWLLRPWLLSATCPVSRPPSAPTAAKEGEPASGTEQREDQPVAETLAVANQRIGIAEFYTAEDARTRRRMNRPFEAVKRLDEGAQARKNGFNLVLAGRLRARGDGRVILCTGEGRDRPPDCIISADIDRVWIEQPENKAVMAEWNI